MIFEKYRYLDNNKFLLFKNRLSGFFGQDSDNLIVNYEDGVSYSNNDLGYRCNNFSKEHAAKNFLFTGCSVTYGFGIPYDFSWGYKLNNDLGGKHFYNLASPGRDFQVIINEIYQYIKIFGKPKAVFAMFPNLDRDHAVSLKELDLSYDIKHVNLLVFDPKSAQNVFETKKDFSAIAKYLTGETMYYNFYNSVSQLEDYLALLEIPFFWTTWDSRLRKSLHQERIFKNYFETEDFVMAHNFKNISPPADLGEYKKYWLHAADGPYGHPGIMRHQFYASQFFKKFGKK
jgi:hypothetical protein